MHALLFSMKRAYQASLASITRPLLRDYGLTPARFDMLYALFSDYLEEEMWLGNAPSGHPIVPQAKLCEILGVSRMTVSRMVRALEELGLVTRTPRNKGGRRLLLQITLRGIELLRAIVRALIRPQAIEFTLDSMLAPTEWHWWHRCVEVKETFEWLLDQVRDECFDRARLYYPWHPDD